MSPGYDYRIDLAVENNSHTQLIRRVPPGSRVLEMGCATGYMSEVLREQLGCRVTGVEYDAEAAARARERLDELIVADVDQPGWDAPLGDRRFDVITCADIIEHLKHPEAFLRALRRHLEPEGRLLVSVPNGAHVAVRLELLEGRLTYEDDGLLDRTHLHFYTHASLAALLRRSGFAIDEFSYTFHDLPDEIIAERLARVGLESSEKALAILHAPDAVAFQFIVSAHVGKDSGHAIELHDLPLRESMEVYRNLLRELDETRRIVIARDETVEALRASVAGIEADRDARLAEKAERIARLEQERNAAEREARALEQQRYALQDEKRRLGEEIARLREQKQRLGEALEAVLHSRGWRLWKGLTAPVRAARLARPLLARIARDPAAGLRESRELLALWRRDGAQALAARLRESARTAPPVANAGDLEIERYRRWRERYERLDSDALVRIGRDIGALQNPPLLSILMPVYNPEPGELREAIESVLAQSYPHWELCIVDDASSASGVARVLREHAARDPRVRVHRRERNGHIAAASNDALAMAKGRFIGLLDQDDRLAPHALYHVAMAIDEQPDVGLIYSDEDKIDVNGRRYGHYFKPDFNPDLLRSHNMISHFGVYRRELVVELGGFREGFDGAQDYDLALRVVDRLERHQIRHLPRILYHWRAGAHSTAADPEAKPYALRAAIRAMEDHLRRNHLDARVAESDLFPGTLRVRYALPAEPPLVSIIIPTRNARRLVEQCIGSIRQQTRYPNYEILLVDNGSDDPAALAAFERLAAEGVRVLPYPHPFNYSAINNFAAGKARGELLAFVNNDIEVIAPDWLDEMVALALRPGTGAVGARLWYPDDRLQHGGVVLGLGGVAGHAMKYLPKGDPGYCARALLRQNYSAVTAACLVVRRVLFEEVDGFDETHLAVAFNDVDLCLRLREVGYDNVWTPWAELYHHESLSRGAEDTPEKQRRFAKECEWMRQRWGELLDRDPAYNPNLTRAREDFSLKE